AADPGPFADAQQRAQIARVLDVLGEDQEVGVAAARARAGGDRLDLGGEAVRDAARDARPGRGVDLLEPDALSAAQLLDLAAPLPRAAALDQHPAHRFRRAAQRLAHRMEAGEPFAHGAPAAGSSPAIRTTASAAIPSPRPSAPSRSLVVALRPTA